ncbi:energy transducer TonB [Parasediminibacterium sp. JCM 36343]|uniref:energy transducer TonB n=1 Tax=Parasediminibacterium sp. JCM 36343 TaxID=3374279 RepID=UPI00397DB191
MNKNMILTADVLDIIFDGRNKAYGAYNLRKTYSKRVAYALLGTFSICLALFLGIVLANSFHKNKPVMEISDMFTLKELPSEAPKAIPPPPPPPMPKVEQTQVDIKQFTKPQIVIDDQVKETPPELKELEKSAIGDYNKEGIKGDEIVAPPIETKGTGLVEALAKKAIDEDPQFTSVQIEAEFPGGRDAWRKFLEKNLKQELPAESGAPPGKYTVVVSFLVDKNGNVSDVVAENDPTYGTASEAVRVIKKGPSWKPAIQNGRNVAYRMRQAISFIVSE